MSLLFFTNSVFVSVVFPEMPDRAFWEQALQGFMPVMLSGCFLGIASSLWIKCKGVTTHQVVSVGQRGILLKPQNPQPARRNPWSNPTCWSAVNMKIAVCLCFWTQNSCVSKAPKHLLYPGPYNLVVIGKFSLLFLRPCWGSKLARNAQSWSNPKQKALNPKPLTP